LLLRDGGRKGHRGKEGPFSHDGGGVGGVCEPSAGGGSGSIEASASGSFVYEQLDEQGIAVHLAHPTMVKPFAKKHVKTDKIDAIVLAQLLRMDYLPESYVPSEAMRDLRTLVRHRASLVRIRTSLKNRVHALLTMEGVQPPGVSDLFGKKGRAFLETVKIRESRRLALDKYLKVLDELNERITEVEKFLEEKVELTEGVEWLRTISSGSIRRRRREEVLR
jgi:transposase